MSLRALCVAVLALAWPASAGASTVTVQPQQEPVFGDEVMYVAGPGERNQLTIAPIGDTGPFTWAYRIIDPGATITPGPWCTSIDAHTAECEPRYFLDEQGKRHVSDPISAYRAVLGDLDDRLAAGPVMADLAPTVFASGGPGDDVLYGGGAELFGRVGGDHLRGGGGRDELHGGDGPDVLMDGDEGDAGADVLDGGPGSDTVSYAGRTRGVRVDLADPGGDGERGEEDALIDVEGIVGGSGDDRLAGDGGPNFIDGHRGDDVLLGRGGDDALTLGGRSISCGRGRDTVHGAYGPALGLRFELEYLRPGCEKVAPRNNVRIQYDPLPAYPAFVTAGAIGYRMRCPSEYDPDTEQDVPGDCSVALAFRESRGAGRLLARAHAMVSGEELVRVPLTRLGRRLVAHGATRATLRVRGKKFGVGLRWSFRLRNR